MSLTDRYLRTVRGNLPRDQQDDIIRELSENLQSQMDDQAADLGRPLTEDDEAAILKRMGNPMVVAARYRGDERTVSFGRRLIGPELFPLYARVLAINVAITVVIGVVLAIVFAGGQGVAPTTYGVAVPLVIQFILVTGIFMAVDRRFVRDPDGWDPHKVGSDSDVIDWTTGPGLAEGIVGPVYERAVPRTTSTFELALLAVAFIWLVSVPPPTTIGFLRPGPGWVDFYLPIVAIVALWMVQPIVNLVRPDWVGFRLIARVVTTAAGIATVLASLAVGNWVLLADPAFATADEESVQSAIDLSIRLSLAFTVLVSGFTAAVDLWRFFRSRSSIASARG